MSENNQKIEKPEEVVYIEQWINGFVSPIAAAIAAIPGLSPQERAVVLDHALKFPAPPWPRAAKVAPGPAAEQKPKEAPAAPAQGAMEPLRPDAGNGDAAISKALAALEWRPAKSGKGEWIFVLDRNGAVEDEFTRPPLRDFLERVKAAPSETGLVLGGYRYRINERFLHRWPLRR